MLYCLWGALKKKLYRALIIIMSESEIVVINGDDDDKVPYVFRTNNGMRCNM
jgi:hypothetical protein